MMPRSVWHVVMTALANSTRAYCVLVTGKITQAKKELSKEAGNSALNEKPAPIDIYLENIGYVR